MATQKQMIAAIQSVLLTDRDFAIKGLLAIYANQTALERGAAMTIEDNGIGFSGAGAEFATSLCEQYNRKGQLSEKQWPYVHKIVKKYAGQLYKMGVRAPENTN